MGKRPLRCPACGASGQDWIRIDKTKKGVSAGKAAVGGILFGPIGLAAGALGKKKETWYCKNCRFEHEYD